MTRKGLIAILLLALLSFLIPIEHKYDKLFRHFSLTLIPSNLKLTHYDPKIFFRLSDLIALSLLGLTPLRNFFHPLWAIFLFATASIIASPFSHYPTAYTHLLQLSTPIILFLFIRNFEDKEKLTKAILYALLFAGLFQSAVAITQYFLQSPLGLRILNESPTPIGYIPANTLWLFGSPLIQTSIMRAFGTLPHPNILGGFLLLSLFTTFILYLKKPHHLLLFSIPLQTFAIFLTFSRSAFFGLLLASTLLFYFNRNKKLFFSLFASLVLSFTLLYPQISNRGGIISSNETSQGSNNVRHELHSLSLRIIKDKPFFGLGYDQFSEQAKTYFNATNSSHAAETAPHNIFLFLACETGLFTLLAFLAFIASLLYQALKNPTPFAPLFLAFLFIGLCDFYFILFQQGRLMFFLIAALLALHTRKENISCVAVT